MLLKKITENGKSEFGKTYRKNVENKEVLPQVENPLVENQGLLTKKVVALLKKKK